MRPVEMEVTEGGDDLIIGLLSPPAEFNDLEDDLMMVMRPRSNTLETFGVVSEVSYNSLDFDCFMKVESPRITFSGSQNQIISSHLRQAFPASLFDDHRRVCDESDGVINNLMLDAFEMTTSQVQLSLYIFDLMADDNFDEFVPVQSHSEIELKQLSEESYEHMDIPDTCASSHGMLMTSSKYNNSNSAPAPSQPNIKKTRSSNMVASLSRDKTTAKRQKLSDNDESDHDSEPEHHESIGVVKKCKKPGCDRNARGASGLCVHHGGGKRCTADGCTKSARAGPVQKCSVHGGGPRCTKEGCTKGAVGRSSLCYSHLHHPLQSEV